MEKLPEIRNINGDNVKMATEITPVRKYDFLLPVTNLIFK